MVLKFCHTLNDLGSFYKTRFLGHTIPIKPESLEVRTRQSYFSRLSRAFQGQPSLRKQMSKVKAIRSPSSHTAAWLSTDTHDASHLNRAGISNCFLRSISFNPTEVFYQDLFCRRDHMTGPRPSPQRVCALKPTDWSQSPGPCPSVNQSKQDKKSQIRPKIINT